MAAGKKLERYKFDAIAKELREHPTLSQKSIAESHHVSQSTVTKVNQTGTWRNFKHSHKARFTITQVAEREAPKTKFEQAKQAGLNPVTAEERRKEKDLAAALEKLENSPTRDELKGLDSYTTRRFIGHGNRISKLERKKDATTVVAWTALIISAVSFVLSVIALARSMAS